MRIFTSYYAMLQYIPEEIEPISIAGKAPDFYTGIEYKKLAPKYKFFMEWKKNHDDAFYIDHYHVEVLDYLTPEKVYQELSDLSNGKDVVLLCYEKSGDFCHRHLVSDWLNQHGIPCEELELGIINYKKKPTLK